MLKSLLLAGVIALAAPGLAFADDNKQDTPGTSTGPSGPATLTVSPPGLSNNPNGPPTMPRVFNGGQPTGGSPNEHGGNGVATFKPASP